MSAPQLPWLGLVSLAGPRFCWRHLKCFSAGEERKARPHSCVLSDMQQSEQSVCRDGPTDCCTTCSLTKQSPSHHQRGSGQPWGCSLPPLLPSTFLPPALQAKGPGGGVVPNKPHQAGFAIFGQGGPEEKRRDVAVVPAQQECLPLWELPLSKPEPVRG